MSGRRTGAALADPGLLAVAGSGPPVHLAACTADSCVSLAVERPCLTNCQAPAQRRHICPPFCVAATFVHCIPSAPEAPKDP